MNQGDVPLTTSHVGDSCHLLEHPIHAAVSAVHLMGKVFQHSEKVSKGTINSSSSCPEASLSHSESTSLVFWPLNCKSKALVCSFTKHGNASQAWW